MAYLFVKYKQGALKSFHSVKKVLTANGIELLSGLCVPKLQESAESCFLIARLIGFVKLH